MNLILNLKGTNNIPYTSKFLFKRSSVVSALGVIALAALVGCNKSEERAAASKQVVAKVNGQEITVHQLKGEFAAASALGGAANPTMTRATLDSLIDEQLLVELAKERKLNRDPQVLQAEEKANRQIVIRALQDSLVAGQPQASDAEIRTFYDANPGLFSNRRIFTFRQFTVDKSAINDDIKGKLDKAKSRDDLAKTFDNANIKYREVITVRPAEQLPMAALPVLTNMKNGDVAIINDSNEANVMQLVESIEQAASLDQATPIIREYLISTKKKQLTADLLKSLRSTAKIEYAGDFAVAAVDGSNKQSAQPGQSGASQSPSAQKGSEHSKENAKADTIRKGLQAEKL